jgi:hypothetical protein
MKSLKQKVLMAGVIFAAAAGSLGASAADQSAFFARQVQITDGYYPQYVVKQPSQPTTPSARMQSTAATVAVPAATRTESPQFERFEHQLSAGTVDNVTPSERAGGSR